MKIVIVRRIVQVLALALLLMTLVWPLNHIWFGTYLSSQLFGFALTDPLAALEVMLAGKMIWKPLIWSIIPLLIVTLLVGRVFCSWVCPLNTVFEGAAVIKATKLHDTTNGWLPYKTLVIFLVLDIITRLPLFTILSPIGILSRAITSGAGFEFLFIGVLVVLELFYNRKLWCRSFCPVGALYGLLAKWRLVTVAIDRSHCSNCRQCDEACSMNVHVGSSNTLDHLTCTNCGDCVDACKAKAVKFVWNKKQKGGALQREFVDGNTR